MHIIIHLLKLKSNYNNSNYNNSNYIFYEAITVKFKSNLV